MSESHEDARPGSEPAAEAVELWLQSRRQTGEEADFVPGTETYVLYLAGALSGEEIHAVERSLVRSASQRAALRETRALLTALQALPWAEAARRAEARTREGEIARIWLRIAAEQVPRTAQARRWWGESLWREAMEQAAAGQKAARAAWAVFRAFGEQWRAALTLPRLATARGDADGERLQIAGSLPPGIRAEAEQVEITDDGALAVRIRFTAEPGQPVEPLAGQRVRIALTFAGEGWTLDAGSVEEDRVAWTIPGVGNALGLPAGLLPPGCLLLAVAETEVLASRALLLAEVLNDEGAPIPDRYAALTLHAPPRLEAERCAVSLSVPAVTRAACPGCRLTLDLLIFGGRWQRLGEWRLEDDAGETPRTLSAPCPGLPDIPEIPVSCLRARLLPPG
jgi:hypothetical protein